MLACCRWRFSAESPPWLRLGSCFRLLFSWESQWPIIMGCFCGIVACFLGLLGPPDMYFASEPLQESHVGAALPFSLWLQPRVCKGGCSQRRLLKIFFGHNLSPDYGALNGRLRPSKKDSPRPPPAAKVAKVWRPPSMRPLKVSSIHAKGMS